MDATKHRVRERTPAITRGYAHAMQHVSRLPNYENQVRNLKGAWPYNVEVFTNKVLEGRLDSLRAKCMTTSWGHEVIHLSDWVRAVEF